MNTRICLPLSLMAMTMTMSALLLLAGCSKSPTSPSDDEHPEISLIPFVNEDFGISSVRPSGWQEYQSGCFKYSSESQDHAELMTLYFPQMNSEWLFTVFLPSSININPPETVVDTIQSDRFIWKIYQHQFTNSSGVNTISDLAIHENDEGVYLICLLSARDDHENLNRDVFIPVLNELELVDTDEPGLYEQGLGLFDYDPLAPLDIQGQEITQYTGFTGTTFTYASPKGGRVPAVILLPEGSAPHPGIVFMHSMPGTYNNIVGLAEIYVRKGVVCLLIDAPHGRPENRDRPEGAVTFTEKDREEQIQLIVDLRRAVDYLISRPDVDFNRLAYIGASYGGGMGGLFAGIENRLKAYVFIVGGGGLVEHVTGFNDYGSIPQTWIEAMWPIEPLHYVGYAAPAALLYQSGLKDQAVLYADAVRYQRAGSAPKQIMWYNTDHWLNEQAYQDQQEWLQQLIGIN